MRHDRYLELIEQDRTLLRSAAGRGDLDAPIPSCPGWTVGDCVTHTADVYRHKVACIRLGREPGTADVPQRPPDGDLLGWFDASAAALVDELRGRSPSEPAYTWWPADQTVGFWYRRMAQETAVHRVDVEDARGAASPVDEDLAVDGIDEVLDIFLGDDWTGVSDEEWDGVDPHAGAGATIAVRAGRVWRSTLWPDRITLTRSEGATDAADAADASVAGDPTAVLLWLWGRRPDGAVALDGDPAVLAAFRARLRLASQ